MFDVYLCWLNIYYIFYRQKSIIFFIHLRFDFFVVIFFLNKSVERSAKKSFIFLVYMYLRCIGKKTFFCWSGKCHLAGTVSAPHILACFIYIHLYTNVFGRKTFLIQPSVCAWYSFAIVYIYIYIAQNTVKMYGVTLLDVSPRKHIDNGSRHRYIRLSMYIVYGYEWVYVWPFFSPLI